MARKHNTKHRRGRSRYRERLAKRGLNASPRMESAEDLAKRQNKRVRPWDPSEMRPPTFAEQMRGDWS